MQVDDFDFDLPEALIARHPAAQRERSRLLRLSRKGEERSSHRFDELPGLLHPGDLLVLNDTRVFPARLLGHRASTGGKTEVLLTQRQSDDTWKALVRPARKVQPGETILFAPDRLKATVLPNDPGSMDGGERLLRFKWRGDWWETIEAFGHTPLPPYIVRSRKLRDPSSAETVDDRARYQTVYAGEERGSVAAPTAGLHFSESIFQALEERGIERAFLQLHVGPGTFQPIKTDRVEDHPMHEEYIRISPETARAVNRARAEGRRVVAVGTTVVRALETAALAAVTSGGEGPFRSESLNAPSENFPKDDGPIAPFSGWTRLLISPGFEFRAVDALLTNFHLPRSTLLLLVSALTGRENLLEAYREAIRLEYRFYSYGDCMLIG